MPLFKKLQENSLYWRYRFLTKRWLAARRWWREVRQPRGQGRVTTLRGRGMRGMAAANPYARSAGADARRGAAFVLAMAAVWTALDLTTLSQGSLLIGLVRIATLSLVAVLFSRFW
ncbi:MAG: hypothetical protein ACRDGS_04390 [Chloroflexota bacterium]